MKLVRRILIVFTIASCVHCAQKCCEVGENELISSNTCLNGDPLKINCSDKFLIEHGERFLATRDDDENLLLDGLHLATENEYCFINNKEYDENSYIVCVPKEFLQPSLESEVMMKITIILQLLSAILIFFTIIVYVILPQMLDLQGISIIHSISGLALGNVSLGIINLSNYLTPVTCHFLAYCAYINLLYAFFWLNVICFHIWRQIINPPILSTVRVWGRLYHAYGIIGPLCCITIVLIIHHADISFLKSIHPGIGEHSCWFKSPREAFIYFYVPVIILISINVVFFVWTSVVLWIQCKISRKTKMMKFRVKMYVKLFLVMGMTWIFEVIQTVIDHGPVTIRWLWYILDCVNASSGIIIFLVLVVFRKKVLRLLANKQLFNVIRFPTEWKYADDSECEEQEVEEEELHNMSHSDDSSS